jgi:hypothetical protein
MKTRLVLTVAIAAFIFFGCSDDDKKKSNSIDGTWNITDAIGVEWEEDESENGNGTVINTNNPDLDMIGEVLEINGTEIALFGGSYPFEYEGGVITIDFGGGETESFNVAFTDSNTMEWTQDEPTDHADYEYNDGGDNYLFYQKSWSLERE